MFKYVSDVSNIYHNIILNFIENKDIAIDATLGNGYDADYLSSIFKKVYAFDIQKQAIESYNNRKPTNVEAINDSHENFKKYILEEVDCIVYNLGYLPGDNKNITTLADSTITSIKEGLNLLKSNGFIIIALYRGHEEGKKETKQVLDFAKKLPKNKYGVILHDFINRTNMPPLLVVIEKK